MSMSEFWDNVLEKDENLLWTGRPAPQLSWRNWRLYAAAPLSALGLIAAAWFILATYGSAGDMWLLLIPACLILIPLRATWQQLRAYAATRYALTDRRVLFFRVDAQGTRVRAYPHEAMIAPKVQPTAPPSVSFIRHGTDTKGQFGFDYIHKAQDLLQHLTRITA